MDVAQAEERDVYENRHRGSTTAGAGAKKVTKSIAKQMFWWGILRIYRMHFIVNAACWEVPDRIKKIIAQTAKLTHNVKRKIGKSKPGIKTVLFFNIFRKMQQSNTWNATDKDYWQKTIGLPPQDHGDKLLITKNKQVRINFSVKFFLFNYYQTVSGTTCLHRTGK